MIRAWKVKSFLRGQKQPKLDSVIGIEKDVLQREIQAIGDEQRRLEAQIGLVNEKIRQEAGARFMGKMEIEIKAILLAYAVQKSEQLGRYCESYKLC